jgi:signal transduction histidine kinase
VGGESGIARHHDRRWETFTSEDRTTPESGLAFLELSDERFWCAAQDRLWEYDGRNWILIRPGFDRISGLAHGRDGSVWVASHSGMWRWWKNAWTENGPDDGLVAPVFAVHETADGRVWAATARGLSQYHPGADPDPPRTEIQKLTSEETLPEGGTLNLLFSGRDKWKFTASARLLYSYRMDQHDWSPFQELNAVSFPDLAAGKHYFQVRAMDRNGNVETSPAQLEFAVALPWYRETRLVLATALGVSAALFFAAVAWNRHRRLLRSYAEVEREVAERTRQLEHASRELLHSQKMNALGTLAAGVAHDFNNILSIVKGSAQIIEDNLDNPQKVRTRVDRIKTVVEQGSGIVKAMLGFSRDSESQVQLCDPNNVVEDTIRLLGDRFLRQTEVRFEPGRDLPQVAASRNFIQQILLNLVFNAAEAAVEDTRVVLATGSISGAPPGLVLTPEPAPRYVTFSVQDFGCGIPPEIVPRIFEPFFTTKSMSARRGTGLGLSMVYELVKRMGGGLAVETAVGKGSKFSLILPVREATGGPGAEAGEVAV